ncbi:MAG: hypothetical protein JW969_19740 [Spirochaetales bacterium]|nr:hypothetical protein [Spirochaetales bacterium]
MPDDIPFLNLEDKAFEFPDFIYPVSRRGLDVFMMNLAYEEPAIYESLYPDYKALRDRNDTVKLISILGISFGTGLILGSFMTYGFILVANFSLNLCIAFASGSWTYREISFGPPYTIIIGVGAGVLLTGVVALFFNIKDEDIQDVFNGYIKYKYN